MLFILYTQDVATYAAKSAVTAAVAQNYIFGQQQTNHLVHLFLTHNSSKGHNGGRKGNNGRHNDDNDGGFRPSRWRSRIHCDDQQTNDKGNTYPKNMGHNSEMRRK